MSTGGFTVHSKETNELQRMISKSEHYVSFSFDGSLASISFFSPVEIDFEAATEDNVRVDTLALGIGVWTAVR